MNGVTEPCPWCRGATIKTRHLGQWAGVDMYAALCQTEGCGATGPTRDTEPAAIAAWNRRAPGWRPIETAPRDGTLVLLWAESIGLHVAYLHQEWSWTKFRVIRTWQALWCEKQSGDEDEGIKPTHWMPLPEPPEAKQ